ncbi:MAG: hypothetical protein A2Z34_04655 [Planctomycetes bacterium RBG_16_59_8]|nr:MAG: hypothetical protein A2Z34_04655 [Planctomycetes bacterium RBG_16_59_8]
MSKLSGLLLLLSLLLSASPHEDAAEIGRLIDMLGDYAPETREGAEKALLALGEKALPLLTEAVAKKEDAEIRLRCERLRKWIPRRDSISPELLNAIPDVLDILASDNEMAKSDLLKTISGGRRRDDPSRHYHIRRQDMAGIVIEIAKELKDPQLKRQTLDLTISHMLPRVAPHLVRLLKPEEESDIQIKAMTVIGNWCEKSAAPAVARLKAKSNDAEVVRSACMLLARLGEKSVTPDILKYLESDDRQVKITAIFALGAVGATEQIDKLLALMEDSDIQVAVVAVKSLELLKNPDALPPIVKFAERTYATTRELPDDINNPIQMPHMALLSALSATAVLARTADPARYEKELEILLAIARAKQRVEWDVAPLAAAQALVAFGREEGADVLLKQRGPMNPMGLGILNKLSNPDLYRKLAGSEHAMDAPFVYENSKAFAEALSKAAGVEVLWGDIAPEGNHEIRAHLPHTRANIIDVLDATTLDGMSYILYNNRITIVQSFQALHFFTTWRREKRKKSAANEKEY